MKILNRHLTQYLDNMNILLGLAIILIAVLIYGCINLLKQVELLEAGVTTIADEYQVVFDEIREKVLQTEIRLKEIDIKGSFEADDEVGFVFKEIVELHSELNKVVQTYYDGGN
jgi:hypothetical protein